MIVEVSSIRATSMDFRIRMVGPYLKQGSVLGRYIPILDEFCTSIVLAPAEAIFSGIGTSFGERNRMCCYFCPYDLVVIVDK